MVAREKQQWVVIGLDPRLPDWPSEETKITFLG